MAWKLPTKPAGGGGEKCPIGNHAAVLVAMVDMGTQRTEFQGEVKWQHRVLWVYELPLEQKSGGGNHVASIELTVSLGSKAKMRKFIESRVGKSMPEDIEYDIEQELGKAVMLNVVASGKSDYPKIDSVSAVPKGFHVPAPTYKPFVWSLDSLTEGAKPVLPDWVPWSYGKPIADIIAECRELSPKEPVGAPVGATGADTGFEPPEGDFPF